MAPGALALVLHAHLPYVRAEEAHSLEEDWFFQALIECYLPLLETLETAAADPQQAPELTMGVSPTLLSLLSDRTLQQRFPAWIEARLSLLKQTPDNRKVAAEHLADSFQRHLSSWHQCEGDLIGRFAALQRQGVLDLLTCGATHGYLPLLREHPEAVRAQLRTAVREHHRLLGERPLGSGCRNALTTKVLTAGCGTRACATPCSMAMVFSMPTLDRATGCMPNREPPRRGLLWSRQRRHAAGVVCQGWLSGDPWYREFHRDLGWDLPTETIAAEGYPPADPLA